MASSPSRSLILPLTLLIVALVGAGWLVGSVTDLHDRLAKVSPWLAVGVVGLLVLAIVAAMLAGARLVWTASRADRPPARAPADVIQAAEVQAKHAEATVAQLNDPSARDRLQQEIARLRADREARTFHLVVFGTCSAGKTSLINALLGHEVGRTEAVMGTTRGAERHTYRLEGAEGVVILTDTPGLSEAGEGGAEREAEARDLAARADLLLFVVDHDLTRSEFRPLAALAKQGKRSIIVLNKKDILTDPDREAILSKLRERLQGIVRGEDVVAVAASRRRVRVVVRQADGTTTREIETQPPDLADLRKRMATVVDREGESLRAANLLLRAHLIGRSAQDALTLERDARAQAIIDRYQWITAGTVFANPIPAVDLMAAGAVQFQMIGEIARAYGLDLTSSHVRMIGGQMIQLLLKLGMVEAATSLVAGLFKSTLAGYAAGGALQATTMAYLTHVTGQTFAEYFRRGQDWGDGGMQAAVVRQFDLNTRADFLQEFARQAVDRVLHKALRGSTTSSGTDTDSTEALRAGR